MRSAFDLPWFAVLAIQFVTAAVPLAILPFLFLHLQRLAAGEDVAAWTAAAAAAPAFSALLTTPLWARLSSKRSLPGLIAATCFLSAASYALQGWAPSPLIFTVARALQGGAGSGIILLVAVSRIRAGTPQGYVSLQQALAAGCLVGPLLGGIAIDHGAFRFLLSSSAFFCMALGLLCAGLLRATPDRIRSGQAGQATTAPDGLSPRDLVCILAASLGTAGAFGFAPFFAIWVMERSGSDMPTTTIGAIHAAGWLAAILVLPLWGRAIQDFSAATSMRCALAGSTLALGLLALPGTIHWIGLMRLAQGGIQSGLAPSLYALVGRSGQADGGIAVARTGLTFGQILGPALCGLALPWGGADGALLVAIMLTLVGFVLVSTGYRP